MNDFFAAIEAHPWTTLVLMAFVVLLSRVLRTKTSIEVRYGESFGKDQD